ncbi:MAG: single-stranded DNA-binding protein [Nitrospirae bacterium]|nr:single-stranded DNA-binding protein [Nitrospirota bacterium]
MASYSKVILIGNLTRAPELRFSAGGTAVAKLGVAVNHRFKKNDQTVDEASFFDVVVFGKQAEVCSEYLGKGRSVLVEGRLRQQRWEKDGQKRSKVEIVADRVRFMGPARGQAEAGGPPAEVHEDEIGAAAAPAPPVAEEEAPVDEDIPF